MPFDLDAILAEFGEDDQAWMLIDALSGAPLNVPAPHSRGQDARFFLCRDDAEVLAKKVLAVNRRTLR